MESKMNAVTSIKFIFLVSQIFGLFPFSLKNVNGRLEFVESPVRLAYTIVVLSFLIAVKTTYICVYDNGFSWTSEILTKFVLFVAAVASYSSLPLVLGTVLSKKKLVCLWLNRFNGLFSNLTAETVKKLCKFNFWLVVGSAGFLVLVGFSELVVRRQTKKLNPAQSIPGMELWMLNYYAILWEVKIFVHYFIIFINTLRELYKEIRKTFKNGKKRLHSKFWVYYLNSIRSKDLIAKDFLCFLNDFFVPVVSIQLLWGFCSMLFITTMTTKIGVPPLIQLVWAAYIIWEIFFVINMCHLTEKEAEKMAHCVQVYFIYCDDVELREEVEVLSLQCQHIKVECYALGFFKLNFALLTVIVGSLTSYAVILIQFQNEQELQEGKHCFRRIVSNCSLLE